MSDAAERLRLRYPAPRLPRPLLVGLVAAGAAVALAWLIWAAAFHARPAVSAQVLSFTVVSDTQVDLTLTVDRRDPAGPVTCRVVAQSADFAVVGEREEPVPASAQPVENLRVRLVTLRRAAAVIAKGCTVP